MNLSNINAIKEFFTAHGTTNISENDIEHYEAIRDMVNTYEQAKAIANCIPLKGFTPKLKSFRSICAILSIDEIQGVLQEIPDIAKYGIPLIWVNANYIIVQFDRNSNRLKYAYYGTFDDVKICEWSDNYAKFLAGLWIGALKSWKEMGISEINAMRIISEMQILKESSPEK